MSNVLLERLGFDRPPPRVQRARGPTAETLARRACSVCRSDEGRIAAWREEGGEMPERACAVDHHEESRHDVRLAVP